MDWIFKSLARVYPNLFANVANMALKMNEREAEPIVLQSTAG